MRSSCLNIMELLGSENENFITIGADGRSIFETFARVFPERYVDVGIAEQNLIGVAAGIARSNRIVFVSAIASFLLRRAYEQIRIDVCNNNLPVKMIGVGGGLSYDTLGSTHHMIEDIALARTLPNTAIFIPADANEAKESIKAALEWDGPAYIRLGTGDEPYFSHQSKFEIGKPTVLRQGKDFMIFATGICVSESLIAAKELETEGYDVGVVNVHTIKPFDEEIVMELSREKKAVIVVEEHSRMGGLGSTIAETLSKYQICPLERMGIDEKRPIVGTREELLNYYQITHPYIMERIRSLA